MIGLVLGPGGIAGEWTAGRLHFVAGEILAAAIIIVPLLTGTILVMVVVFGGTKSSDRVFRLLRWFSDKEEPPAPALSPPGPLLTSTGRRKNRLSVCAAERISHALITKRVAQQASDLSRSRRQH
jgi:hypothetical protein